MAGVHIDQILLRLHRKLLRHKDDIILLLMDPRFVNYLMV